MSSYVVERSIVVGAPVERVHDLVAGLRRWQSWSPWEGLGARYAWSGNRRAGRGTMEVTGDAADRVEVAVVFEKPFRSSSTSTFLLVPAGGGTEVTWRMTGEQWTGWSARTSRGDWPGSRPPPRRRDAQRPSRSCSSIAL